MKNILLVILISLIALTALAQGEPEEYFDFAVDPDLYLLRPGDNLEIVFLKATIDPLKLSVNPEAKIIDINIGIIEVEGKTLSDIKILLKEKLSNLYQSADIEVSITRPRMISIMVTGAVRNPGMYSAQSFHRVSSIIERAGGIVKGGSTRNIIFSGGPKSIPVDLDRAKFRGELKLDPPVYAGIKLFVPAKSIKRVQVMGEVYHPRELELIDEDNIDMLIELAGGMRSSGDYNSIEIYRGNQLVKTTEIKNRDIIFIPNIILSQHERVFIFGSIKNPGYYDLSTGMSLPELINSAGGYLPDANSDLTTIFRQPKTDARGRKTTIRYPISFSNDNEFSLVPGDSVFVPVKIGYVKVVGEVANPGYYPFTNNHDALYYINLAGGFLPNAEKTNIILLTSVSNISSIVSPQVNVYDGCEIIVELKEELK